MQVWVAAVVLGVGALFIAAGVVVLVVRARRRPVRRVQLPGVVVRHVAFRRPPMLELQYPAPDGTPMTGRTSAGLSRQTFLRPGSPVTVWVDPQQPEDVALDPGGPRRHGWIITAVVFLFIGFTAAMIGGVLLALV